MIPNMDLQTIQDHLVKALRANELREAARWVVQARSEHFLTKEGLPDYSGRSWAYRTWFSDVTNSLNLPDPERARLMARLRFHVGNHLRDEVREEELSEAGLLAVSPVERGRRYFERRSSPYRIISSDKRLYSDAEIEEVCEILHRISTRLDINKISKSSLHELQAAVEDMRARTIR